MSEYDASSIQVLTGLQAVRKRPGMYVGGVEGPGVRHLVLEVVANSIDEHRAGHASTVTVAHAGGAWTVSDDGRGIPHEAFGPVFERLHAGSTWDGHRPHAHLGLHGVGLAVVNGLSSLCVVRSDREGRRWQQAWSRGEPLGEGSDLGDTTARGTLVHWQPDVAIFAEAAHLGPEALGLDEVWHRVACLCPSLTIRGERVHHEPDGVVVLAREIAGEGRELMVCTMRDDIRVDLAVVFGGTDRRAIGFSDLLPAGGSHLIGAMRVLDRTHPGRPLAAVVAVELRNARYRGPSRETLDVPDVERVVAEVLEEALSGY